MVETGSQCLATAKKFIHSSLQSRRCQKLGDALWCSHGHEADNTLTALVREEPSPPVSHLFFFCIALYSPANLGYVKLECARQLKWFQLSVHHCQDRGWILPVHFKTQSSASPAEPGNKHSQLHCCTDRKTRLIFTVSTNLVQPQTDFYQAWKRRRLGEVIQTLDNKQMASRHGSV